MSRRPTTLVASSVSDFHIIAVVATSFLGALFSPTMHTCFSVTISTSLDNTLIFVHFDFGENDLEAGEMDDCHLDAMLG